MTQIALLAEAGIDFMEISGGSYEDPKMMGYGTANPAPKSARTAAREAFFLEFSKEVRQRHPELVLMLTGGFRSRAGAEAAIRDNACDLVGIGRPAAVDPKFPRLLLDESVGDDEAQMPLNKAPIPWYMRFLPLNLVGAGSESVGLSFFAFGCFKRFSNEFDRRSMLRRFRNWVRGLLPLRLLGRSLAVYIHRMKPFGGSRDSSLVTRFIVFVTSY